MKISEIKVGYEFETNAKGKCTVYNVTPRTISVFHKFGKTKVTYNSKDAYFSTSDF